MINWFDMPDEGLSNGGLFEIKELTATENKVYEKAGEVYNKVTVNVEGGGGSSDFSTAEVVVSITGNIGYPVILPIVLDGDYSILGAMSIYESGTFTVATYKNASGGILDINILENFSVNTSGDVSYDTSEGLFTITGDCTITISARE